MLLLDLLGVLSSRGLHKQYESLMVKSYLSWNLVDYWCGAAWKQYLQKHPRLETLP